MQASQSPSHPVLQHTPSTHSFEPHSPDAAQASPSVFFSVQFPIGSQNSVSAQLVSSTQSPTQRSPMHPSSHDCWPSTHTRAEQAPYFFTPSMHVGD